MSLCSYSVGARACGHFYPREVKGDNLGRVLSYAQKEKQKKQAAFKIEDFNTFLWCPFLVGILSLRSKYLLKGH